MSGQEQEPRTVAQVQLIGITVASSPLIYILVCILLSLFVLEPGKGFIDGLGDIGHLLFSLSLVIGIVSLNVGVYIRNRIARQANGMEERLRAMLVGMALVQTGSILGMIHYFCTGELVRGIILMLMGFLGSIFLFPTKSWLLDHDKSPWEREE